jgi:hypothetical protein
MSGHGNAVDRTRVPTSAVMTVPTSARPLGPSGSALGVEKSVDKYVDETPSADREAHLGCPGAPGGDLRRNAHPAAVPIVATAPTLGRSRRVEQSNDRGPRCRASAICARRGVSRDVLGRMAARGGQRAPVVVRVVSSVAPALAEDERPELDEPRRPDEAEEFVRFCYRRRQVEWPQLYDEMCAVAAHGSFRGMCYEDLSSRGISFALNELPRLAALAHRVAAEDEESSRVRALDEAGLVHGPLVAVGGS